MDLNNSIQDNHTFTFPLRLPLIPVHTAITLYSILLVWSLVGNVLVIAVVFCNQNLRTNMNYLIVNMAVSDLLVPLVFMPWMISLYAGRPWEWLVDGPLGDALCKLVPFLADISIPVSTISLVIIAFQRFIAVVYPTRRQIARCKIRFIAISLPWIVAMALFSPDFYTYRLTNERAGYTMCSSSLSPAFEDWPAQTIFLSIQTAVCFVIPLTLIIVFAVMVYKLRDLSLNNVEPETVRSRDRRIFGMILTIIIMFTICWCPYYIMVLIIEVSSLRHTNHLTIIVDLDIVNKMIFVFWYILGLLAAINPCIYFLFLRDFRQGLKRLCCRETASANELISRRPIIPDGDDDQDPTCTPLHINTTSI